LGDLYVYNIKIDPYLSIITVVAVLIFLEKSNYIMKYKDISERKVTNTGAKNFILTLVLICHTGSRRYASHLHILVIDI